MLATQADREKRERRALKALMAQPDRREREGGTECKGPWDQLDPGVSEVGEVEQGARVFRDPKETRGSQVLQAPSA